MKKPEHANPNYALKKARESQGWTQEELAEMLGTTSVTVSRWESGITFPSRYFRKKLCNLYGRSIQELHLQPDEKGVSEKKGVFPFAEVTDADMMALEVLPPARSDPVFFFNEPLLTPQEFFVRRRERETLLSRTYRRASTSIVGPRRIGKTWLLNYLLLVAPMELGTRFHVGYLDATMPGCHNVAGFTAEALEVLGIPSSHHIRGLISLEKGLKTLRANNCVPVLCIDEFEGLSDRKEFLLDFFRGLRAMTHTTGLVLITVSRSPLSTVVGKDVETSGFFNIFEQVNLRPFTVQEADEFITTKSKQAQFSDCECHNLWRYSEDGERQWPPVRLQLVGKLLQEAHCDRNHDDPEYWETFTQRLEEMYREII